MTVNEAFKSIAVAINRELEETVGKWGYTVKVVKKDQNLIYWHVDEFSKYEVIVAYKKDPYIHLRGTPSESLCIYPERDSPKLKEIVADFVKQAAKEVITFLAWKNLRGILYGATVGIMKDRIMVEIEPCTLYLKFDLKDDWGWEITAEDGSVITSIRQPISEHPIHSLLEVAKCFSLALI